MIPQAYITEWSSKAPWPTSVQIEQDLILSRLIIELAQDSILAEELAFRGGTCLHHLFMKTPLRYSEDLDYTRTSNTAIGPILDAVRSIGIRIGLSATRWKVGHEMARMLFDAEPTEGIGRIRIKVEINTRETASCRAYNKVLYATESRWWTGSSLIPTFSLEEILATKLRALYQRRKGRDLFDIWAGLVILGAETREIVSCFRFYVPENLVTKKQYQHNLSAKLQNADFLDDLELLLVDRPDNFSVEGAADLVSRTLIDLL